MTLWEMGEKVAALCVLTMFTTYGRPNEILKLQKEDLAKSTKLGVSWALNLNTSEEMFTSKTGLADESILLDSSVMLYLGPALERLAQGVPTLPLFRLDYARLLQLWKWAWTQIGMEPNYAVLYQLRHSGASWDRLKHLRTTQNSEVGGQQLQEVRESCQGCSVVQGSPKNKKVGRGISSVVKGDGYGIFAPIEPNGLKPVIDMYAGRAAMSKQFRRVGFAVHAYE